MSDRKRYFEQSRSWALDTRIKDARHLRHAWIITGAAIAIALFEAVAIALLTPLKTVQPITLLVDRQTGFVQALDPMQPRRIGADEALTQSFLAQYVLAREGFDRATVSRDYQRVALWSAGSARAQYLSFMPAANPQSPFQRYPSGTVLVVRVKSVSKLAGGRALIRFDTELQDRAGRADAARPWISIVQYRYSDAPMRFEDRLVNPLGFQVVSYRRDSEAAPIASRQPRSSSPSSMNDTPPDAAPNAVGALATRRSGAQGSLLTLAGRAMDMDHIPMGSPLVPLRSPGGRNAGEVLQ